MNHDFFFTKVRWPNFQAHFGKKKNQKRSCTVHCVIVRKGRKRNRYLKRKSRKKEKVKKGMLKQNSKKMGTRKSKNFPGSGTKPRGERKKDLFIFWEEEKVV